MKYIILMMKTLHFFSDYLTAKYGMKLQRLAFDLALGCPNRINRFGPGCAFCAEDGARARHLARNLNLAAQAAAGKEYLRRRYHTEGPYIAYFQSFTSTYAPAARLRELYEEALKQADFPMLIVSTRPDALEPDVIAYLQELAREREVWVELGVQSTEDSVLQLIRRGHDFDCVCRAAERLAAAGIHTAAHVIAGLPGETAESFICGAEKLARLPIEGIKIHPLLLLKHTPLASDDFPVKGTLLNEYEYAAQVREFLHRLPETVLIMRLTAEAPEELLIGPKWWMTKGQFLEYFKKSFAAPEPESFEKVRSADGSFTMYHPAFRQHFHSLAGAVSEAHIKFCEAAGLAGRLEKGDVSLLDVGFGLGVNVLEACRMAEEKKRGVLHITSLEYDDRVLPAALKLHDKGSREEKILSSLLQTGTFSSPYAHVRLLLNDARKSVSAFPPETRFDVIFQDGFSPDCNPELWSYDFVRELKKHLSPGGVIASYCASHAYRGALLRNHFRIGESVPFGRKRGGTVAALEISFVLDEKEYGIIRHSVAGVAYRDAGLGCSAEKMIAFRKKEVEFLRRHEIPKWYKGGK